MESTVGDSAFFSPLIKPPGGGRRVCVECRDVGLDVQEWGFVEDMHRADAKDVARATELPDDRYTAIGRGRSAAA